MGADTDQIRSFLHWTRERALPRWGTDGFDTARGRFVERLDRDGRPLAVPHRAMVQARQIYVYAHAAELGWYLPGAALAEEAMASLRRDFVEEGASWASVAFSVEPGSTRVVSDSRDSYTHAFVLLAIAQLYRITGDPTLLEFAGRIVAFIERHLVDTVHGGVVDALPIASAAKRQNPQMHLLESYLALAEVAPHDGWLDRARVIIALFHDRLTNPQHGVVLEHFAADWNVHPDPTMATVFEPGHHYEWIWLLDRYAQQSGLVSPWIDTLYDTIWQTGHAPSGLIYDEIDVIAGKSKASHRLWPHTEAIKAGTVRIGSEKEGTALAERMAKALLDRFLNTPFPGGWVDRISAGGAPLVDHVPASSLYHLMLAATEADRTWSTGERQP